MQQITDIEKEYGHIRPELAASLYHKVNEMHTENLNWDQWMEFINTFQIVKVKRGEYLVREGQAKALLYNERHAKVFCAGRRP